MEHGASMTISAIRVRTLRVLVVVLCIYLST